MIIIIDALNRHKFAGILDDMHQLRARTFSDRLGWNVKVTDGREIDEFDALDPAHIVSLNEAGEVVGCMRLLQTTGPHMLADVFQDLLDGEPPLRSSRIWEATRFCVDAGKLSGGKTKNSISYVTSEVMIGAFEYGKAAGVLDAVAVIDPVMNRVMKRSNNAPYDYLGSTKPMGKVRAMAALMDCSQERIDGLRAFSGITHDVFLSEEEALMKHARGKALKLAVKEFGTSVEAATDVNRPQTRKATKNDLQHYCYEQILNAECQEDIDAAYALMEMLKGKLGTTDPQKLRQLAANTADLHSNMSRH